MKPKIKESLRKKGISIFAAFILLASVYVLIPSNAKGVYVIINDLNESYNKGEIIEIIAEIEIEDGERIPINYILLEIAGASQVNATFDVEGGDISVPPWINITLLTEYNPDYQYGYGYGYYYYDYGPRHGYQYDYGYGYGYGEDFDFGYGYGYVGLLKYIIQIDSAYLNVGNHSMQLYAYTGSIIHQRFSSDTYYFNLMAMGSVHNIDTDEYFNEIQAAIDDVDTLDGHTIEVSAGTYNENVVVSKSLTIKGADKNTTIIDGSNSGDVVRISVNGITFEEFTIQNSGNTSGDAGIELIDVGDCVIERNKIQYNNDGICIGASSNNAITENIIVNNNLGLRSNYIKVEKTLAGLTHYGGISDYGTMFQMDLSGSNYTKMHDFIPGYIDGRDPYYSSLIQDEFDANIMYGTTRLGGICNDGTIFTINKDGSNYTTIHNFSAATNNGEIPEGGLIQEGSSLYGMTLYGGEYGRGTLFCVNTDGSDFTLLHSFSSATDDGANPYGDLTLNGTTLYGMTGYGGANEEGTIFSINTDGSGFTLLHNFSTATNDGENPYGSLTLDGMTLYGMTQLGGANDEGTIFSIEKDGSGFTVLHSFESITTNGENPYGGLSQNGSTLYGMTYYGGDYDEGTIFCIDTDGSNFTLLHSFRSISTNGENPRGSLITDGLSLYGMTENGGTSDRGTIFSIDMDGNTFTILHSHSYFKDGTEVPVGRVIQDDSILYGMTQFGGANNYGSIFCINIDGSNYSVLHNFSGGNGGANPSGSLIQYGNILYGMTLYGGTNGEGAIFCINTDGSDYTIIHNFTAAIDDGENPYGSLIIDGTTLYGMTQYGGAYDDGIIFSINTDGNSFSLLHSFRSISTNGENPHGSLIIEGSTLYGMTIRGGVSGEGIIFSINTDGSNFTLVHSFSTAINNGENPRGDLILDGSTLYGMTEFGGANDDGTIFSINTNGTDFSIIHSFVRTTDGEGPYGSLIQDGNILYGMTTSGGASSASGGTVFKINKDTEAYTVIHHFEVEPDDGRTPTYNELSFILTYVQVTSNSNKIYHNNFINNTVQAYDDNNNTWDNGYPSGGNYWSDYAGVDFNSTPTQDVPPPDGIGDTPYTNIQGGSGAQDNYPLMNPWIAQNESTYNLNLTLGWNLISLPLIQSDESINAALSSIAGKWDYIQAYNTTDPDNWKTYSIHKPGQLNDILTIGHSMGFWINITDTNVTLTVSGTIPTSTNINLYAGWNLVGYPTQTTETVANALFGTGADRVMVCDTLESYNIKEVGPTYIMKPGEGYWVHVPFDTVWTVDW